MNLQEAKQLTLIHYMLVSELIADESITFKKALDVIYREKMMNGVCHYINEMFDIWVYGDTWITKYIGPHESYWGLPLCYSRTKEEILSALQVRIDNLIKELS